MASSLIFVFGVALVGLVLLVGLYPLIWAPSSRWPVVVIPLAIGLMRPMKAALIAQQYRHRASEMGL